MHLDEFGNILEKLEKREIDIISFVLYTYILILCEERVLQLVYLYKKKICVSVCLCVCVFVSPFLRDGLFDWRENFTAD